MSNYPEEFAIWLWENKYLQSSTFKTLDGQKIRLIFRGSRNHDSGPDFQNVTIEQNHQIRSGYIEIHIDSHDWYTHGHHTDPVYNQVILHLVLNPTHSEQNSQCENGLSVPIVNLAQYLPESMDHLFAKYSKLQNIHQMPDTACPTSKLSELEILNKLDQAGAARMTLKALAFRELRMFNSWDQILYTGMMEALGYSKNREAFRKLATHLPIEFIFRELRATPPADIELKIQGLLFGAAGLLPFQNRQTQEIVNPEIKSYALCLESIWNDFRHRIGIRPMQASEWKFFRLRPQNFPTRRLAGMCYLQQRFYEAGIFNNILRIFSGLHDDIELISVELEKLLLCKGKGFWEDHYHFEETGTNTWRHKKNNLIGADRARDLVVNVILPVFLLSAHERNDGRIEALVKESYRRYPLLSENSITREMKQKLFPGSRKRNKWINSAQKQQGLIYLHKNYCHENKCQQCLAF
jgi:hypothetical protein